MSEYINYEYTGKLAYELTLRNEGDGDVCRQAQAIMKDCRSKLDSLINKYNLDVFVSLGDSITERIIVRLKPKPIEDNGQATQ